MSSENDELDDNGLEPAAATGPTDFFQDAGPAFDPDAIPEPTDPEPEGEDIGWTPDGVASFLRDVQAPAFNSLLNPLLGVSETDWSHREKRLQQVAPAIAREWNRIPHIRALAGQTDRAIILSYFLLEYFPPRAFDVIEERKQRRAEAIAAQQEAEPQGAPVVERQVEHARPTNLPPRRR